VFCEKPLATTEEACSRIIDAEVEAGRRLVQVGFMRRYDAAYRAMKDVVDSGHIGTPLLVHSRHRNPSVPEHYTREMAITDTAVHDFDTVRWLLGEELVSATVLTPRRSRHGGELQDPLLMLFETESGALVDVETSVNIRYGYDIRGEIVGEDGTVALADTAPVLVRRNGTVSGRVPEDWRERFIRAYDVELQEWVDAVAAGRGATGPSSWDGYAAAVVSDAAVEALRSGTKVPVTLRDKPDLYDKEG
jgi:myo-inositol 2-dehydrogenase/D-chiro-inositol 1-dehydrogenase